MTNTINENVSSPKFSKKILSSYLRVNCKRQASLYLYKGNSEEGKEKPLGMPPPQQVRAGAGIAGQQGDKWQAKKVEELKRFFGKENVIHSDYNEKSFKYDRFELSEKLEEVQACHFLIEAKFSIVEDFKKQFRLDKLEDIYGNLLEFTEFAPDIIAVYPPNLMDEEIKFKQITHDGKIVPIASDDTRLRLRVIDVKLNSTPSINYYSEVVIYSLALASWLKNQPNGDKFIVVDKPAILAGNYNDSHLHDYVIENLVNQREHKNLFEAFEQDLKIAEAETYLPRIDTFFSKELPEILKAEWELLDWQPTAKCLNCEYLGFPWPSKDNDTKVEPEHCWLKSYKNHLDPDDTKSSSDISFKSVAGLTPSESKILSGRITSLKELASLQSTDEVFTRSRALTLKKHQIIARANSLLKDEVKVISGQGSVNSIASFVNLQICIFIDYDPSTAISYCFAANSSWIEPKTYSKKDEPKKSKQWEKQFIVANDTVEAEKKQFLEFLKYLKEIIKFVNTETNLDNKYQIYLWDDAQYRHLERLMGRHLQSILEDKNLRDLAWFFPPEDILPESDFAALISPICLLSPIINRHFALPIPIYYNLLAVGKYLPVLNAEGEAYFTRNVELRYNDPLSNLVPSERIYEAWSGQGDWHKTSGKITETTATKAKFLSYVKQKIINYKGELEITKVDAPILNRVSQNSKLQPESNLINEFAKLNVKLQQVDSEQSYLLSPEEREEKFLSIRIEHLIDGDQRNQILSKFIEECPEYNNDLDELFVYKISQDSKNSKIKERELGCMLSPEDMPLFALSTLRNLIKQNKFNTNNELKVLEILNIESYQLNTILKDTGFVDIELLSFDRNKLTVIIKPGYKSKLKLFSQLGINLEKNVIIDNFSHDYSSRKIASSLEAIGKPKAARPLIDSDKNIVKNVSEKLKGSGDIKPWQNFWYFAKDMSSSTTDICETSNFHQHLVDHGIKLDDSQKLAWENALTKRLTIIWGPPGTGKSSTLIAIIISHLKNALDENKPLRILITAQNYTAVDNLLYSLLKRNYVVNNNVNIYRVQSAFRINDLDNSLGIVQDIRLKTKQPDEKTLALQNELTSNKTISLVFAPSQQVHNLSVAGFKKDGKNFGRFGKALTHIRAEWFDLVIIDEASQMDVAFSSLILSKAAENAICILAGDDLQLPPIHQAEPPLHQEDLVGSIYSFMTKRHSINSSQLLINRRSNEDIVEFTKEAGYSNGLKSHSPNLSLNIIQNIDLSKPVSWIDKVCFTEKWASILAPEKKVVAIVYDDEESGQINEFEAESIVAMIQCLYGKIGEPKNRLDSEGNLITTETETYDNKDFWSKGVGVVAPHRAQSGRISDLIYDVFSERPDIQVSNEEIKSAVDTVERYQGQERDVIFASFGVGDPDVIINEEEFLFNLNRFNVLVSRATVKVIVFITNSLLKHLSNDEKVLKDSKLIKTYVESFCNYSEEVELPYFNNGNQETKKVLIKYHKT